MLGVPGGQSSPKPELGPLWATVCAARAHNLPQRRLPGPEICFHYLLAHNFLFTSSMYSGETPQTDFSIGPTREDVRLPVNSTIQAVLQVL